MGPLQNKMGFTPGRPRPQEAGSTCPSSTKPRKPPTRSTQPAPSHHGPRPANASFPRCLHPRISQAGASPPPWPQSTLPPSKSSGQSPPDPERCFRLLPMPTDAIDVASLPKSRQVHTGWKTVTSLDSSQIIEGACAPQGHPLTHSRCQCPEHKVVSPTTCTESTRWRLPFPSIPMNSAGQPGG